MYQQKTFLFCKKLNNRYNKNLNKAPKKGTISLYFKKTNELKANVMNLNNNNQLFRSYTKK